MKRKLIVLLVFSIIGMGKCGMPCRSQLPDYCGIDGTVVRVNNQPRIIYSK